MKKFNFLLYNFVLGGILFLNSCISPPEYPDTPHIEFKAIERCASIEAGFKKDSLIIVTRFEDGDGDLGLTAEEAKQPPYNEAGKDKNYFIDVLIKKNGSFVPLQMSFNYNGTFFHLSPDNRVGPIEGDLRYSSIVIRNNQPLVVPGDILKFRIYILDRAFNKSNIVETDEIVMFTGESSGACN